ncbi:ABC transporter permease [Piscinibacter koreensis]|uniref:MlaE family lipid ABC transporter permease subunit n=1 Tax=Piscinibacter koreensis TaxID=2742824 RepID=A0A7Y6NR57_9BURK|nr:MlaE family lipid ABC transporter permease subunit [Schlegelella koreensis]NUZ07825.1 MlaE family lipid ABC transporter permease subunit [Schlegelella koreensis]
MTDAAASIEEDVTDPAAPTLRIAGRLDARALARLWGDALATLARHPDQPVGIDGAGITYCDTAGAALLINLLRQPRRAGAAVHVRSLPDAVRELVARFDAADLRAPQRTQGASPRATERIGRAAAQWGRDTRSVIEFVGEATLALARAARRPASVRWRDVLGTAQEAGVNALPIVGLIAFLMGVILAFQAATALQRFGAEVFVADLVGLSLLRELGPLMTAIMLAGRSGAAFAAEIGTMKINEEIDALDTMGFDKTRFLVVSRVIAAVAVIPVLSIFANLIGLFGGSLVMATFDITIASYWREVINIVDLSDLFTGLGKSLVFGLLVAGVGCLRGLQTRTGAAAVGLSTTSAVVSGIVLIVVADGIFAVVFFYLGI